MHLTFWTLALWGPVRKVKNIKCKSNEYKSNNSQSRVHITYLLSPFTISNIESLVVIAFEFASYARWPVIRSVISSTS